MTETKAITEDIASTEYYSPLAFQVNTPIDTARVKGKSFGALLLYYREAVFDKIFRKEDLDEMIQYYFSYSVLFSAIFGAVLGFYSLNLQIVAGSLKAPILLWGTLGVCLPALYTFNVLLGSKMSIKQTLAVLSMSTYLLATILVSLAPIVLFFIISSSGKNFVLLLNVISFGIAGVFGTSLLWNAMGYITMRSGYPYNAKIIQTWTLIYAFVGTQFAWLLRPFVGDPSSFALVREVGGNFYTGFFWVLMNLIG